MSQQIRSIAYGFALGCAGFLLAGWLGTYMTTQITDNVYLVYFGGTIVGALPFTYIFIGGLRALGPAQGRNEIENGLPKIFGNYIDWYVMPSGWSWWFPPGIGGYTAIDIRRREIEKDDDHGGKLQKIVTRDGLEVKIAALIPWKVVDLRLFVDVKNPEILLLKAIELTLRHYVSLIWAIDVPRQLGGISRAIAGEDNMFEGDAIVITRNVEESGIYFNRDPDDQEKAWQLLKLHLPANFNPQRRMRDIGIEIVDPSVFDVDLPRGLVDAMEGKRTEEAQRISQLTQAGTINLSAKAMRKGLRRIDDNGVLALAAAADGHATFIHVAGGDSLTRSAALIHEGLKGDTS